jgi:hypothetical protein
MLLVQTVAASICREDEDTTLRLWSCGGCVTQKTAMNYDEGASWGNILKHMLIPIVGLGRS